MYTVQFITKLQWTNNGLAPMSAVFCGHTPSRNLPYWPLWNGSLMVSYFLIWHGAFSRCLPSRKSNGRVLDRRGQSTTSYTHQGQCVPKYTGVWHSPPSQQNSTGRGRDATPWPQEGGQHFNAQRHVNRRKNSRSQEYTWEPEWSPSLAMTSLPLTSLVGGWADSN